MHQPQHTETQTEAEKVKHYISHGPGGRCISPVTEPESMTEEQYEENQQTDSDLMPFADKLRQAAHVHDAVQKQDKRWEFESITGWKEHTDRSLLNLQSIIGAGWNVRVKSEEPKSRPWNRSEDVPAICWVRHGNFPRHIGLIVGLSDGGIDTIGVNSNGLHPCFTAWDRLSGTEYSTDRKTWQPCTVTEAKFST